MSLALRLSAVIPSATNNGCRTCRYLADLSPTDRRAFDDWITEGHSATQLWEVCCADGLEISMTGFRHHMKHHQAYES